jgi:opacity protein-like surface antigen
MSDDQKLLCRKIVFVLCAMAVLACNTSSENPFYEAGFEKSLCKHISETDKFRARIQASSGKRKDSQKRSDSLVQFFRPDHMGVNTSYSYSAGESNGGVNSYNDSIVADSSNEPKSKKSLHNAGHFVKVNEETFPGITTAAAESDDGADSRPPKHENRHSGHFAMVREEQFPEIDPIDNPNYVIYTASSIKNNPENKQKPSAKQGQDIISKYDNKYKHDSFKRAKLPTNDTYRNDDSSSYDSNLERHDDKEEEEPVRYAEHHENVYSRKNRASYYTNLLNSCGSISTQNNKFNSRSERNDYRRASAEQLVHNDYRRASAEQLVQRESSNFKRASSRRPARNLLTDELNSATKQKYQVASRKKRASSGRQRVPEKVQELVRTLRAVSDEIRVMEVSVNAFGVDPSKLCLAEPVRKRKSHMYAGLGIDGGYFMNKDSIRSKPRTYTWNEQKIDYYSMISSIFCYPKRNSDGTIYYGPDGYPVYVARRHPKDDPRIMACYDLEDKVRQAEAIDQDENGLVNHALHSNMRPGREEEVKKILKELVDELLGISKSSDQTKSLNIAFTQEKAIEGAEEGDTESYFRFSDVKIGDNNYGAEDDFSFYFGIKNSPEERLSYYDGIGNIENLLWTNLIFTDAPSYVNPGHNNKGKHLTLAQVLGSVLEQSYENTRYNTAAGMIGTFSNMYSERYSINNSDKFTRTEILPAITDSIKTYKPSIGVSAFFGFGIYFDSAYFGVELSGGCSFAKSSSLTRVEKKDYDNLNKAAVPPVEVSATEKTIFADGNVQYVDKDEKIISKVTGAVIGNVYDPATGKVRPIYVSGMGRMAGATPKSLLDTSDFYDVEIRKGLNFSVNPIIGITGTNTMYYVSLGVSLDKYEITIKPNEKIFESYKDKLPVGYVGGYMDSLGGDSFIHKYTVKEVDGQLYTIDQKSSIPKIGVNDKVVPIYPGAVLEENTSHEKNTFAGVRLIYPHYDDGGVSVVGESSSRPWLDQALQTEASVPQKISKFKFSFEPGIGVRTFMNSNYFVDFRYSAKIGSNFEIDQKSFEAYPAHMGRPGLTHSISITEHKAKISFGRTF